MINVLILLLIWTSIVGIYYGFAKSLTNNLSEEVFIEVMTARFIQFRQFRKMKRVENFGYLSLILSFFLSVNAYNFFEKIQYWLFAEKDGLFINYLGYGLIPFILALGTWTLTNLFFARFEKTPAEGWYARIEIWEAFALARRGKIIGLIVAFLLQVMFIFGMANYTIIKDNTIYYCSFFQLKPTEVSFSEIEDVKIFMKIEESNIRAKFLIALKGGKNINITKGNSIDFSFLESYKKLVITLKKNKVSLKIQQPNVLDKYKMREKMSRGEYETTMAFFTFLSMLEKGIHKKYAIGEPIKYENMSYQVDSVVVDNGNYFTSYSKDKDYVIVYMSVENKRDTTANFYKLLSLKIEDGNGEKYMESMIATYKKENHTLIEMLDEIPSKEKISGGIVYQLPKNAKNLTLKYDLSYINDDELKFDLER